VIEKIDGRNFSDRRSAAHARAALTESMAYVLDSGQGILPRTGSAE
jgi:hypothetical protein